jgi:hypothetical protein
MPARKTDCPECHGAKPHRTSNPVANQCPLARERHLRRMREAQRARRADPKCRERDREYDRKRRRELLAVGLCTGCRTREAEFGITQCLRCCRHHAERKYLGYSTIPLAKGSEG